MKISLDWLSDFVTWKEKDPHAIADRVTRAVGEVDDVVLQGSRLSHVVVGRVKNLRKHPNADKLSLCDVETDKGMKPVVCGGTNLKEGMLVAFAHIGARVVWHGTEEVTLEQAKIRGETSEGMICAAEELELAAQFPAQPHDGERPIIALPEHLKVGAPLRDALGLTDSVLHIDNHAITNRPDLFSHKGVARECVALGLATWKKAAKKPALKFPAAPSSVVMRVDDADLVSKYFACRIDIDAHGETPDWMRRRLEATGWRSINLPTDITNYVMMETGVPLHSFDADDIKGVVHLRGAKAGEEITTLDKVKRKLPEGAIVLSDDEGIFDLLGIMGGLRSSTKETTRRIYLHSASVNPVAIRRTIVATGHRTDAATVYEKGVPHVIAEEGFIRACELFLELVPGARIVSRKEIFGKTAAPRAITVELARVSSMIGADIKETKIKQILTDLGYAVSKAAKGNLKAAPPAWRTDVGGDADVIEDIARIHGYDEIEPMMPSARITPPPRDHRLSRLRDGFKEERFIEQLHVAFVSPALLAASGMGESDAVKIANPLGEELSLMRTSLLPRLLETAAREARGTATIRFFEIGSVFHDDGEHVECTALITGKTDDDAAGEPLLALKRSLRNAVMHAGHALSFAPADATAPWMHGGRTAKIACDDAVIGTLTELHPQVAQRFGLAARTAVASLSVTELMARAPREQAARPLPLFPAIRYDETIAVTKERTARKILEGAQGAHPLLETVESVGLYPAPEGMRLTLRFTYRAPDRTLPESDVLPIHQQIIASLVTS